MEGKMESLSELEKIYEQYWQMEDGYIVMPNTIRARTYLEDVTKDINIKVILDNNAEFAGSFYEGIQVEYAPEFLKKNSKGKILVSSHYAEVANQLKQAGYQENVDFIDMHLFVSMWYWKEKQQIRLLDVHTAITTYCSLNCQNCNMFINHYKKEQKRYIELQEFKENFEILFKNVDYCYKVSILGGEPLLHKELPQMLEWLFVKYHERIGEIAITTNGTILPREDLLDILQKTRTTISISDYSKNVTYGERIDALEGLLGLKGIKYERNREKIWKDFYFPRKKQGVHFSSVREHMLCCNPVFRGLNDKKFYYCHIVWSAEQAGLLKATTSDYVDLEEISDSYGKRKLLEHDLGFVKNGYISLCSYCGGCGYDNQNLIHAGIQEKASSI